MPIPRRSFSNFLSTQRRRSGLAGRVVHELLATGRRFTPDSAFEWMLVGPIASFDDEYAALATLVEEYRRTREAA